MNVLMVLTSHDDLGDSGEKTGFWLEEFAAPYYRLLDAGVNLTLASPAGGQPPVDPKSADSDAQTDATRRFNDDGRAKQKLANTVRLDEVDANHFDAVFYPGGHGPLWDLYQDPISIALIEYMYGQAKPVAAVCHAPAVLLNTKTQDGQPLVKDKQVTGFSNSEEAAVGLSEVVPYLLEDALKKNGGHYSKGEDWAPHVKVDGHLITGQNPASSEATAEALLEQLKQ